jgi:hypothetical protein
MYVGTPHPSSPHLYTEGRTQMQRETILLQLTRDFAYPQRVRFI